MDLIDFARYLGALFMVLALVGIAGLVARRWGLPGIAKAGALRRLSVVESLMLSPRERLLIIRRDNVEHLISLGPDGARVIETGITPPAPPPMPTPATIVTQEAAS
jgi:flagellar protein FliO/FliZ